MRNLQVLLKSTQYTIYKKMTQNIRRTTLLLCLISFIIGAFAQAPQGYYRNSKGKSGAALKTALYGIISNHVERSYKQLWEDMKKTDVREDGKIWDMYSNVTNFTPGKDQAGSYSKEGDVYNREHSFPKSWFDDATPMYTDLFHLYPTDGYINGMRSNYPFGETKNPSKTSKNGFSKLGPCSTPGYSGTVFEPDDEYKGDFARSYFYMATAYEGRFPSFHSPMLAGNKYPCYEKWALDMLLRWAKKDPVSQKEIDRNNAVYKIQKNRNPYIDYPGLEQYVWGDKTSSSFDPDNYDQNGGGGEVDPEPTPDPTTVAAPTFNPAPGMVAAGTEVSISSATAGAYIYYTLNNGVEEIGFSPVKLTINENTSISAYAMVGETPSKTVKATYTLEGETPSGSNVYALITETSKLVSGQRVLIVGDCKGTNYAMGNSAGAYRNQVKVEVAANQTIETDANVAGFPYAFQMSQEAGVWNIYDETSDTYLALQNSGNKLQESKNKNEQDAQWNITIDGSHHALIQSVKYDERFICYNNSASRFACYKSSSNQLPVSLYGLMTATGITEITQNAQGIVRVYDLNGRLVRSSHSAEEALQQLPCGFYIVNGQKILVK